jgi:hypothetical protein
MIARRMRRILLACLAVALSGCGGGDDRRSPTALQNDGGEGGTATTQCQVGGQVVVTVLVDGPGDAFYGMHTRLRYPASLALPGHRDDQSVVNRVRFVVAEPIVRLDVPEDTFADGSTVVNDEDSDSTASTTGCRPC